MPVGVGEPHIDMSEYSASFSARSKYETQLVLFWFYRPKCCSGWNANLRFLILLLFGRYSGFSYLATSFQELYLPSSVLMESNMIPYLFIFGMRKILFPLQNLRASSLVSALIRIEYAKVL